MITFLVSYSSISCLIYKRSGDQWREGKGETSRAEAGAPGLQDGHSLRLFQTKCTLTRARVASAEVSLPSWDWESSGSNNILIIKTIECDMHETATQPRRSLDTDAEV